MQATLSSVNEAYHLSGHVAGCVVVLWLYAVDLVRLDQQLLTTRR